MKIIYKQGDLLECSEQVIVHGCNAQGVMGSGVAKAIKEKYPQAYRDYSSAYKEGELQLGTSVVSGGDKLVISAITQQHYGRDKSKVYVEYSTINSVFHALNSFCARRGITHIAMPKIGAGLANGDWNIIEKIIEEECTDVQPVVYVLEGENTWLI